MKENASEDFNDLKNLLFNDDTNDSTIPNTMTSHHDNHNNNLYHIPNNSIPMKKEDESKIKRMTTRLISGWLMVGTFVGTMYLGHIYMCTLIFLVEVALVSKIEVSPFHI
jgi:hypothetical protein